MKSYFPPQNQNFRYLQTNRSDRLGSIWSSFNLDFQSKLGTLRVANKLVTNTTSSDDADLGLPVAFEFYYSEWWAICGTRIFKNSSPELTAPFIEDTSSYDGREIGDSTTQFDVSNPAGTTFRYEYDGTGTNPNIYVDFIVGSTIIITATNMAAGNEGTFIITGNGINYFEVTNAAGVVESNKTIGSGSIFLKIPTIGVDYSSTTSDMKVFNDKLWVSSATALRSKFSDLGGVNWVDVAMFATAFAFHILVYFQKTNRLYFVSNNVTIGSVNSSDAVSVSGTYTLEVGALTSIGFISSMVASISFIWIGTFQNNTNNTDPIRDNRTKGAILRWDGSTSQFFQFDIEIAGVLAMCVVNDIPYALDTEGRILKYTGAAFQEIARLPIDRTLLTNTTAILVNHFVHFNGMVATKNNTILININNLNHDAQADVNENLPSGIWELDLETKNFTHRYSPTLKARSSSTITDYGQNRISAVGAVKINTLQSASVNGRSTLIAGFNYFTDASTIKSGIFIDSPAKGLNDYEGQKRGYFVTTWFESSEITDNWTRIWATYRRLLNSSDKIVFKYRQNEEEAVLATIIWTSTTTFTTTTDISAYVGGEVEILQGTGSGSCTHITSISLALGVYTVTLDTAVLGVTGTAKARFQKWIKLGEISGQILSYGQLPIIANDNRIQIKGCLEFTGDNELYGVTLVSTPDLKAIA
jgi:hypothetical protein